MAVLVRALVSWLLTIGWAFLVSLGTLCLAFGNFVVAWQSFTAQGFERSPLRHVPLLGAWAEGFGVGDAPIAALYALVLTVTMNLAIMAAVKVLARTMQLFFEGRQALRSDDPGVLGTAPIYRDQTIRYGIYSATLFVASVLIVGWDVSQFNYRYENLFSPVSDPSEVLSWAPDAAGRLGEFVAEFIRTAKWGYIGCVVALAVALEYAISRAVENWQSLHTALDQAVAMGVPGDAQLPDGVATRTAAPPVYDQQARADFAVPVTPSWTGGTAAAPSPADMPEATPVSPPPPMTSAPEPAVLREESAVNVIVAPGRVEQFLLSEVRRDSDRFVRDGSGRAWFLRTYWEQVMGARSKKGAG